MIWLTVLKKNALWFTFFFLFLPSLVNKKKVLVRDSPQSQVNSFLIARQNAVLRELVWIRYLGGEIRSAMKSVEL